MPKKPTTKRKVPTMPDPSSYDNIRAELTIERIQREVKMCCARYTIDLRAFDKAELRAVEDKVAERLILELRAKVASKKFAVQTVKFPATWRDSVKEAASTWLRQHGFHRVANWIIMKRKINYTEVTMEANAYHPSIEIPGHETFVEILHHARMVPRY